MQTIHEQVYEALRPSQLLLLDQPALTSLWAHVNNAADILPAAILQWICTAASNREKRALVRNCQVALVAMANRLHSYSRTLIELPVNASERDLQVRAYHQLRDQLIRTLDVFDYFPGCPDKKIPLPNHIYEAACIEMRAAATAIQVQWQARIDGQLVELLLQPFHDFMAVSTLPNPGYEAIDYLHLLSGKLAALTAVCPERNSCYYLCIGPIKF